MICLHTLWKQLSVRQRRILIQVFRHESGMLPEVLAEKVGVSVRTIRADLAALEALLQDASVQLQRKPGIGIVLVAEQGEDRAFLQIQSGLPQETYLDERKLYIALKLLLGNKGAMTETALGQQLFVSRTSISNEVELLARWFAEFDILLVKKKNYGIYLEGEELNRRNALFAVFQSMYVGAQDAEQERPQYERISAAGVQVLGWIYPGFDGKPVERLLCQMEQYNGATLQQSVFTTLWFAVCTVVYRVRTGHALDFAKEQFPDFFPFENTEIAQQLVSDLEEAYRFRLPAVEADYLSMLVKSTGIFREMDTKGVPQLPSDDIFKAFLADVVHTIEVILNIRLSEDDELLGNFAYHLACTVMRLKYGIKVRNLLLPEIKINHPSALGATWACSVLFEKYYGLRVTEDEIGFLALYVSMFSIRCRRAVKACVVCNYGIGVTGLLSESLSSSIPNLNVVDALPSSRYQALRAMGRKDWDIVITTLDLPETELPVIRVSTILTQEDLRRIRRMIRDQMRSISPDTQVSAALEARLFTPDRVIWNLKARDKDFAIRYACEQLVKSGHVTERFLSSVLGRERMVSTEVGSGIAIPHGNPRYVKRPAIVVMKLETPVAWGNNQQVDLIFVLALKMEPGSGEALNAKRFYKKLAYILDDQAVLDKLKNLENSEDFCAYFNRA